VTIVKVQSSNRDADYRHLIRNAYGVVPRRGVPLARASRAIGLSVDPGTGFIASPDALAYEEYVVVRGDPPIDVAADQPQAASSAPAVPTIPPAPPANPISATVPAPSNGASAANVAESRPTQPTDVAAAGTYPPEAQAPPVTSTAVSGVQPAAINHQSPAYAPTPEPLPATVPDPGKSLDAGGSGAPPLEGTISEPEPARMPVSDEDLAADMQAILTGQKVYDPQLKRMRERDGAPEPAASMPLREPPARPTDAPNEQSIFDRIAESMEYANSFDLGDVELQRRFRTFDQRAEKPAPRARMPRDGGRRGETPTPQSGPMTLGQLIPLRDFHGAYDKSPGPWVGLPGRDVGLDAASFASAAGSERSAPLYDTGEHVLAGEIAAASAPLSIGGVSFTYGDIISMGDFFATPDELLQAPHQQLAALKGLIDQSTAYYRNPSGPHPVSNEDWDRATDGRYLRLAENNYAHFSPSSLIGASFSQTKPDNRSEWQRWHERAIRDAQAEHLRTPQATPDLHGPMTINAFADHFLTDAFASGHLVNKEQVIDAFRRNFFTGGQLNTAGAGFFEKVAGKAFVGRVRERFSALETTSFPVCAGGWCIPWQPNINSVSRFTELLQTAATQEPVKIANVAVKALHDQLNAEGVRVVNGAGDPEWALHGDGHLDGTSLAIMMKAVNQSLANVRDPEILASNLNVGAFFDKVWRMTPRPTPAGNSQIHAAMQTYTSPASGALIDAAARILTEQLDATINVLLASGQLKEA
jgi:hypothetical protein